MKADTLNMFGNKIDHITSFINCNMTGSYCSYSNWDAALPVVVKRELMMYSLIWSFRNGSE